MRASVLVSLLAGCGARAPAPGPGVAPATVGDCPAHGASVAGVLDGRRPVASVHGIAVTTAARGDHSGLAWLARDGSLAFAPLPGSFDLCVPEGDGVRCFRAPVRKPDGTLLPLRTLYASLHGAGAVERWNGAPWATPRAAASDGRHALVLFTKDNALRVAVWNVKRGQLLALSPTLVGPFRPLEAWCSAGHCTLAGISASRVVVFRALGLRRDVAADNVLQATVVTSGAHHLLFWIGRDGAVRRRLLDADGQAVDTGLALGSTARVNALGNGLLGVHGSGGWSIADVGADGALGPLQPLGIDSVGLKAARSGKGVVAVALDGDVDYDNAGTYGFHSWTFRARWRWLAPRVRTPWKPLLGRDQPSSGDGRGSWDVFLLTRPGRVSALVVPRGDAVGPRRLVALRVPCPAP